MKTSKIEAKSGNGQNFLGKVDCGDHQEDSCADCPQGNGEIWCNGDCKWVNGNCLSKGLYLIMHLYNINC